MNGKSLRGPWVIASIALLLLAVILILGNQSFKATENAAFDEFNQRQLVLARAAAGGIELYFETLAGDLRALARLPEVQHLDDEAPTRREIQHTFDKLEPLGVNDVGVLDADGILRYNAMAPQIEGVDFSWRGYYQEARGMTSSDTYVVEFIEFQGVEAGQRGVLVAVPVFETSTDENYPAPSGRFAGVVLCTLRLDTITEEFVAPVKSSERGHAFLIDDEHNVLWSPDRSLFGSDLLEAGAGFPTFQRVVERMGAGNPGAAEYSYYKFEDSAGEHTADTEEKLIAYAPIHLGSEVWAIGVWAPQEDARRLIRSAYLGQLLVVGSSVLVILLGFSYALATFFRTSKLMEQEVETKTGELRESHERLVGALDSLEAAHAFQQSIIDGVTEPIMVIDVDHRVRLMNRAAREFSAGGADASELLLCYQVSHRRETPCDGMEHPCPLEQVRESGQPVTVVHEHHQADGERRLVEVIASPLWGGDGAFQGIIESVSDITERERAAEALQQYTERLRALAARLTEVRETERQRLARELHDQVGQNLTALGINLNIVKSQMPEEAAPVLSRLDDSLALVEQTAERIRDVMANLRPPVLDDYGLVAALHWYGERFAQRTGIAIGVEGEEPVPRLAARVENGLFRIAQEALTNVVKHAQATRVTVTVEVDSGTLRLVVADDGIGFDPAQMAETDVGRGWGLLTMAERAEAVGGHFCVESVPGQGAQVIVEVGR